jgi:ABC-2 type transport system ATP-binding protein/lipopolysaccharide transport system ATP-binding protein
LTARATVVEVENLGKRYRLGELGAGDLRRLAGRLLSRAKEREAPQSFWALQDITFSVRHGEVVGIIGRNGAGKSTLLRILTRITEPTVGVARTRGRVGALLEVGTGFHHELTGRENVYLNGAVLGLSREAVRRRFDEIIEFAGTERFVDTPLKRYSSGMQLRLAFAVAAHLEPEILIVDEILAVGDAEFQRRCLGRMTELTREGRTVLFVTHDHGTMARLVSRVIWLEQGRIVADGPTAEVITRYQNATAPPRGRRTPVLPRNGPVAVEDIDVYGSEPGSEPRRGVPLHVAVRLRLDEPALGLDVGFYLKTARGEWVVNEAWSDHAETPFPGDRAGTYSVLAEIPPVLPAGEYVLALWVGSYYEELIDEDVLTFEIGARAEDPAEAVTRPRLVQPGVAWRLMAPSERR